LRLQTPHLDGDDRHASGPGSTAIEAVLRDFCPFLAGVLAPSLLLYAQPTPAGVIVAGTAGRTV